MNIGSMVNRIWLGAQPLLVIAGSKAESKWMSDLMSRAASVDKTFHIVEGANHMALYDIPRYIDEAVSKLAPFFAASR